MPNQISNESFEQSALDRLDRIIRLIALSGITGKARPEQLMLLSRSGFHPKEIADLLGTTPNTVRVMLHRLRKRAAESAETVDAEELTAD
jgi:DNA-directed RNA polymerase specialized sigma24 family protein